jgi:hypothetical protein
MSRAFVHACKETADAGPAKGSSPIRRVFDAKADNGVLVPAFWRLEVANSLTMAVRRRRIDPDFRRADLAPARHQD